MQQQPLVDGYALCLLVAIIGFFVLGILWLILNPSRFSKTIDFDSYTKDIKTPTSNYSSSSFEVTVPNSMIKQYGTVENFRKTAPPEHVKAYDTVKEACERMSKNVKDMEAKFEEMRKSAKI